MTDVEDLVKQLRARARQAGTSWVEERLLHDAAYMIERQEAEIKRLSAARAA